jgi:rod shape-determining protein MreB and related proteins
MVKKNETNQAEEILTVGIDLGTSRSAIVASNTRRTWDESYVGWPKDFIAKKILGVSILYGAKAVKHRLSLDLYRPLKNGVIKEGTARDEEAVKELINHLISKVRSEHNKEKVRAVVGVPAESFKANKLAIKKAFAESAQSLLVVSEPFAVAYGVGALDNALIVDIGAGTVDFCIMHGTVPTEEDQRTELTAGDFIDQQLYSFMKERFPQSDFNLNMVRRFKEEFSFVGEPVKEVEVDIPVDGRPTKHNITEDMRRACESILPAIVECMLELIAKSDPEFQDAVRNNVILAGGGSQIAGLATYLEKVLREYGGCKVQVVQNPLYSGAEGALELAMDMPREYWTDLT